jgi:transposase
LPIGKKPVFIDFPVQRVGCLACGAIRQANIGFAAERRSYTKAFERYALELSRYMTIKDPTYLKNRLSISLTLIITVPARDRKVRDLGLLQYCLFFNGLEIPCNDRCSA